MFGKGRGVEDKTDFYLHCFKYVFFQCKLKTFKETFVVFLEYIRDLEELLHKPTDSHFIVFWCQNY